MQRSPVLLSHVSSLSLSPLLWLLSSLLISSHRMAPLTSQSSAYASEQPDDEVSVQQLVLSRPFAAFPRCRSRCFLRVSFTDEAVGVQGGWSASETTLLGLAFIAMALFVAANIYDIRSGANDRLGHPTSTHHPIKTILLIHLSTPSF